MRLSALFLLSVPFSAFFTTAQSILDDLPIESETATVGTDLAPVGRLHPKRLASKRDFGLSYEHTLHHAEVHHETASHYHSILEFDFRWPAILTSDHDEISKVSCSDDSLDLQFRSAADFGTAQKWPTPMLLITDRFDALCRPTNELHAVYVESIMEADEGSKTLKLDAFGVDWATAAREYWLKIGRVGHAEPYTSTISKRGNPLAPHFTVNPGFNWDDSSKSVSNPSMHMFGGANDEATASYSLDCLNCTFHGDFTMALETGSILADLALDAVLLIAKAAHAAEKAIVKVFSKVANIPVVKKITNIVNSVSSIGSKAISLFGKIAKSGKKKHKRRDLFLRAHSPLNGTPAQSKVALKKALALLDAETRPQIQKLARLARQNGIPVATATAPLLKLVHTERQQLIAMASKAPQEVSTKSRRSVSTLAARGLAGSPSLDVSGNLFGNLDFALTLQGELTVASMEKELFNRGIPSLTLPKVAVIGPYVKLVAVAELRFEANITLTTGVAMNWTGLAAHMPLGSGKSGMTTGKHVQLDWHKPQLVLNEAKATIGAYLEPQLLFGLDLLINNKEYSAGVSFKSGLEYSLGYGDDDCGDGVMARLDFTNELDALIYGAGDEKGNKKGKKPAKPKKKKGKRALADSLDTSLLLVKRGKGAEKEPKDPKEIPLWTADPVHLWHSCASLTPMLCPAMINNTRLATWDDHTNVCQCTAGIWSKPAKTCLCQIAGQSLVLDHSNNPQCACSIGTSLVTATNGTSSCAPNIVKIIGPVSLSASSSGSTVYSGSLTSSDGPSASTDPVVSASLRASASESGGLNPSNVASADSGSSSIFSASGSDSLASVLPNYSINSAYSSGSSTFDDASASGSASASAVASDSQSQSTAMPSNSGYSSADSSNSASGQPSGSSVLSSPPPTSSPLPPPPGPDTIYNDVPADIPTNLNFHNHYKNGTAMQTPWTGTSNFGPWGDNICNNGGQYCQLYYNQQQSVTQTLTGYTVGQTYTVSVALSANCAGGSNFRLTLADGNNLSNVYVDQDLSASLQPGWSTQAYNFTAASPNIQITATGSSYCGQAYVDNLSIV